MSLCMRLNSSVKLMLNRCKLSPISVFGGRDLTENVRISIDKQ